MLAELVLGLGLGVTADGVGVLGEKGPIHLTVQLLHRSGGVGGSSGSLSP